MVKKKEKSDLIKIEGTTYKKEAFMIEEDHPAVGRILIIEGMKFKVLDNEMIRTSHRSGTYIAKVTEADEEKMKEYDEAIEELSEKLVNRVDIKRLIKENMKDKTMQEIKTGLFILKAEEDGEKIEDEHHRGCYNYKMHYKNQTFEFITGNDVIHDIRL